MRPRRPHRVPRGLCLVEHIAPRLLDIGFLAPFGGRQQKRRTLEVGGRNDYRIDLLKSEQVLGILKGARARGRIQPRQRVQPVPG
jgi:hypothetical protein